MDSKERMCRDLHSTNKTKKMHLINTMKDTTISKSTKVSRNLKKNKLVSTPRRRNECLRHWSINTFTHKELCNRLSSSEVRSYTEKRPFCVFEPPLRGLWTTYDVHLWLIEKRVVDFLLALIELFARCYR